MSEPVLIVVNRNSDGSPDFSFESWQESLRLNYEHVVREKFRKHLLAVAAKWRSEHAEDPR